MRSAAQMVARWSIIASFVLAGVALARHEWGWMLGGFLLGAVSGSLYDYASEIAA